MTTPDAPHEETFIRLCKCGDMRDAVRIAEKLFVDSVAADCPTWAIMVSTAYRSIAIAAALKLGEDGSVTTKEIQVIVDALVKQTRRIMTDPGELLDRAHEKSEALHG